MDGRIALFVTGEERDLSVVIDHIARCAEQAPDAVAMRCDQRTITYAMLPFVIAGEAARIHSADPSSAPVHIELAALPCGAISALALRQLGRTLITIEPGSSKAFRDGALTDAGASSSIDRYGIRDLGGCGSEFAHGAARIHYALDGRDGLCRTIMSDEQYLDSDPACILGAFLGALAAEPAFPVADR